MYCGNSQARTVIRDHEFYFPKGHNKMTGINGESKQERMKFDVILTSCEMINVDTEILKPIKWKCMVVLSYIIIIIIMIVYIYSLFFKHHMLLINHFSWLDC